MALASEILGGRYALEERIGRGGYGEVWRATDTILSRPVAVKLLYPGYARQLEALARFQAEARHAGSLSHQNIARVYDYGEPADGSPYLVMEFIDGPSLADLLSGGPLDAVRSMDVLAQTAAGLQAAHAVGLIHRDVKPANLLLDSGGTVKITDFGIAHSIGSAPMTITGDLIGTPGYLAPERVAGSRATSASDLYSLGIVAYECLVGTAPFHGTPLIVALAHQQRPLPPLPPSVPADVAALVADLTAKDPAGRPGSADEVARRASQLRDDLRLRTDYGLTPEMPALAHVSTGPTQPWRAALGRRRAGLALAAVVLAAVIGLMSTSLNGPSFGSRPASAPPSPAQSSGLSPGTRTSAANSTAQHGGATGTSPASPAAAVGPRTTVSSSANQEPSKTPSASPSHTNGNGNGKGKGKGKVNGKGKGKGNGNAQTVSASR